MHRSRVVIRREVVIGIRKDVIMEFVVMSVGVAVFFAGTYSIVIAVSVFNLHFR